MIFPKPLSPGDTIALVGLASCVGAEDREGAVRLAAGQLERLGYRVVIDPTAYGAWGYLTASDQERAAALTRAFADPSIDAVWCTRGGYGCTRMLDLVDWQIIREHPKAFIGYSDITAVHAAMHSLCDLATFHGPMVYSDRFEGAQLESLLHAVTGQPDAELKNIDGTSLRALRGGTAQGELVGGNLSLMAAISGSRYMPDLHGKLLFLEDVGEKVYIMDRYFTTLKLSGKLDECEGIIFGGFTHVDEGEHGFSMNELLEQVGAQVKCPVLCDLQAGHLPEKITLPFGRTYRMDADRKTITMIP